MHGYVIIFKNGRKDTRIYKSKAKAETHIRNLVKNNSLKQRQMTGYVGMRVIQYGLNLREVMEMKRVKDFIHM